MYITTRPKLLFASFKTAILILLFTISPISSACQWASLFAEDGKIPKGDLGPIQMSVGKFIDDFKPKSYSPKVPLRVVFDVGNMDDQSLQVGGHVEVNAGNDCYWVSINFFDGLVFWPHMRSSIWDYDSLNTTPHNWRPGERYLDSIIERVFEANKDQEPDLVLSFNIDKSLINEGRFEMEMTVADYRTQNDIDNFVFKVDLLNKYKPRRGAIVHLQLAYKDYLDDIAKRLFENRAKYKQITSTGKGSDCAGDKDKFSEQYVDFKYQNYPSKCDKYSDGFRVMDEMVKLYKKCPELDKGTGARAKFKEQYYKMKKLKSQHCN